VLIALSMGIAAVVFLQVVFRYVLRQPLFWSEELPRYLLIWMSFLAAALAQKTEAHINITLCLTWLPRRSWLHLGQSHHPGIPGGAGL
jgi:TRAP-type C4-dicarboxylate transport system permease small subunit